MNADIDMALADAERALEADDITTAIAGYVEAGDLAVGYQLWRSALRSYQHALELDLTSRVTVSKLVALGNRLHSMPDWLAYKVALDAHAWPHFGCRNAQIVIGDRGAHIECAPMGCVIRIAMTTSERIEARPDDRFVGMPLAMGLTIIHRALWPIEPKTAVRLQVAFGDHSRVWLGVVGGWEPA